MDILGPTQGWLEGPANTDRWNGDWLDSATDGKMNCHQAGHTTQRRVLTQLVGPYILGHGAVIAVEYNTTLLESDIRVYFQVQPYYKRFAPNTGVQNTHTHTQTQSKATLCAPNKTSSNNISAAVRKRGRVLQQRISVTNVIHQPPAFDKLTCLKIRQFIKEKDVISKQWNNRET